MLAFDLPTVWAFIIAFAIFAYVVMDGFDLGIGILFSWIPTGRERDTGTGGSAGRRGSGRLRRRRRRRREHRQSERTAPHDRGRP